MFGFYHECNACGKTVKVETSRNNADWNIQMPDDWVLLQLPNETFPNHYCSIQCVEEYFLKYKEELEESKKLAEERAKQPF